MARAFTVAIRTPPLDADALEWVHHADRLEGPRIAVGGWGMGDDGVGTGTLRVRAATAHDALLFVREVVSEQYGAEVGERLDMRAEPSAGDRGAGPDDDDLGELRWV